MKRNFQDITLDSQGNTSKKTDPVNVNSDYNDDKAIDLLDQYFINNNLKNVTNSLLLSVTNKSNTTNMNPLDIFSIKYIYDNDNSIMYHLFERFFIKLISDKILGRPMRGGASSASIFKSKIGYEENIDNVYKKYFGQYFPSKYIGKNDSNGYYFVIKQSPVYLNNMYIPLNYKLIKHNEDNFYDVVNGFYLNRLLYDKNHPNETRPHTISFTTLIDWAHINKDRSKSNINSEEPFNYYQLSKTDLGFELNIEEFGDNYNGFSLFLIKLLHALLIAQCQYDFIHRDLHDQNILVKKLDPSKFLGKTHFIFDIPYINDEFYTISMPINNNSGI